MKIISLSVSLTSCFGGVFPSSPAPPEVVEYLGGYGVPGPSETQRSSCQDKHQLRQPGGQACCHYSFLTVAFWCSLVSPLSKLRI